MLDVDPTRSQWWLLFGGVTAFWTLEFHCFSYVIVYVQDSPPGRNRTYLAVRRLVYSQIQDRPDL